ncbi:MAG TPA: DUF3316 domain-containing protein [Fermentimonas caenicola]|jgi:hypothetical protein|uniref:Secreted protein n=1 Tax=Fermentimonas caenicola TaxID=1562970 RepID=A0A098C273_9BACT|nr:MULTISPECIES: DUF3316 domain-containing protein [Lascolabacillus]MBP6175208.1 DUF3316 domain-containing protein [Fermentimonas sp.]MDI9626410.1 DUF3316 domain-containing protein [Bacteroidota bacterium]TAH61997.1 MAG: DUF3316 domain-containing protein [Fermentimonas caenicola]MBP6195963.1 DUF3316 domain-containing protein [Fermentimonas sp.]MBP7104529.1 DUF3316 domain-containing protein [Fermentimonas sp.]
MKRIPFLVFIWFSLSCLLFSQESTQQSVIPVNQSTLIGIGKAYLEDSYLSPIKYEGIAISLLHDRIKASRKYGSNILIQNQFRIQTAITKNPTLSSSEYWGNLNYNLNIFYPLIDSGKLRLYGGGGTEALFGGIYNVRNTNNPGSLKTYVNLNLSSMVLYKLRNLSLRWQLSTPFAGMFFSPEYGHSYYEIFTLGNDKGTVHFGSFHNQLALRSYFTVDIPFKNLTIRTGYLWDYYATDVNELITRTNAHQFMLGLAFESLYVGGKRAQDKSIIKSVYY